MKDLLRGWKRGMTISARPSTKSGSGSKSYAEQQESDRLLQGVYGSDGCSVGTKVQHNFIHFELDCFPQQSRECTNIKKIVS